MLQEAHGDSSDAGHVTQVREPCELMSEVTSLTKLSHSSHSVAVSGLVMGGPPRLPFLYYPGSLCADLVPNRLWVREGEIHVAQIFCYAAGRRTAGRFSKNNPSYRARRLWP